MKRVFIQTVHILGAKDCANVGDDDSDVVSRYVAYR